MLSTTTKTRTCPECGETFTLTPARGKQKVFCSAEHKLAHSNRRTARGKALVAIAQGMRRAYATSRKDATTAEFAKFLYADMMAMLDNWNTEDRVAGRMDPVDYAKSLTDFQPCHPDFNNGRTFEANRWFDRQDVRKA